MKLKIAYHRPQGSAVDLIVETDATATVADVVREIVTTDPAPSGPESTTLALTIAVRAPGDPSTVTLDPNQQMGEAALGSGFDVKLVPLGVGAPASSPQGGAVASAKLRVLEGPDAGREWNLRAGANTLGRDPAADVVLSDTLVSRQHARVEVGTTIDVVDLNSANGLEVDGGIVTRATLTSGQVVTIGDSKIVVDLTSAAPHAPAAAAPTSEIQGGSLPFNRSPRVEPRFPFTELPRPEVPSEIDNMPFPWLLLIAPVLLGVTLFIVTKNALSLLTVALSPLMLASNYYMTRLRNRRRLRSQISRFEKQLEALDARLAADAPRERQVRNDEAPATGRVVDAVMQLNPLLWTRRPEHWSFLHVRLGTGSATSRTVVAPPQNQTEGLPELEEKLSAVEQRYRYIDGVPLTESLAMAGALGLAGPNDAAARAAQAILVQLTGLHSPAEVVLAAIGGAQTAHDFEWLKWVPHTSAPQSPIAGSHLATGPATAGALLTELEELVDSRLGAKGDGPRPALAAEPTATAEGGRVGIEDIPTDVAAIPAIVLVIGADAPVSRARIVQLAERAPDAGIYTIWLASDPTKLPAVCRTFVDVSGAVPSIGYVRHGISVRDVEVEGLTRDVVGPVGRRMAAITDAGASVADQSDLPRSISILSVLGSGVADDPELVVDRWRQNQSIHDRSSPPKPRRRAGSLRALVGQRGADSMHLDLRADGPHALVGGTTGSGKSEFLQTWVLGMAAEYSPDRVTFLFVDYKGGAAFGDCVDLPHCVGLVTDLSPHLVRRALSSLKAELRRREGILKAKSAKDILDLEKTGDPECPPALVLVIDEFAALATDVPEFVEGVVDIAQRGRSLGINLIMATQRPAGVIKDNLRANTNLRIALRMSDESNSADVVGTGDAAAFDPTIPGRAVAKTGPGRLVPFQAAYAGGRTTDEPDAPSIVIRELRFGAATEWEKPPAPEVSGDPGPTDLSRTVQAMSMAANAASVKPPLRPWLNELAREYDLAALSPRSDRQLIIGRNDQPDEQAQETVYFYPDSDGNLAIYGTGGSGKSVLLRTLAIGAGVTPRGGPVHVYGLDFAAGGLRMLEDLPHVGSIISGDDNERVLRLLQYIKSIADKRSREFPPHVSNIVDYRRISGNEEEPRILLLVDGLPAFRTEYESAGARAVAWSTLQQLISDGRRLGIHVAFTADRPAGVPGAITSSVPRRVVMRMAEESMYLVLDVPSDVLTATSPPGRALVDGLETQVAVLGGSTNAADQSEAVKKLALSIGARHHVAAPPILSMPTSITADVMPDEVGRLPVIGISETDLQPMGFVDEGVMLLGGGPSSGRSNALMALVLAIRRASPHRPLHYLGHRRSALTTLPFWTDTVTTPEDAALVAKRLAEELAADDAPPAVVIIEAIGDFQGTPADAAIVALTKVVKRSAHLLIAESETSAWNSSFPLFTEIKTARRGLLLQPDTIEGDTILKTTFPRGSRADFPPGRGIYASGGKAVKVQVPLVVTAD